jgi:hypothetical protein
MLLLVDSRGLLAVVLRWALAGAKDAWGCAIAPVGAIAGCWFGLLFSGTF